MASGRKTVPLAQLMSEESEKFADWPSQAMVTGAARTVDKMRVAIVNVGGIDAATAAGGAQVGAC